MRIEHVLMLWAAHATVDEILRRTSFIAADSLFSLLGLLFRIIFRAILKPFKQE
jgi:hypothetical protein